MNTLIANNIRTYPLTLVDSEGLYVFDNKGNKYLDLAGGVAVLNFGHKHPRLLQALTSQAGKISIVPRLFYNEPLQNLLNRVCPMSGMDKGLPMNSGAEAVETALKASRKWGYLIKKIPKDQAEIIVCEGGFHGRTLSTISMSTVNKYKENFGPLTPGFKWIPFNNIEALENAITFNTAAFIVEPIQGEAGVIIPNPDYLKQCENLCRAHNVLLIVDEIQTGMGRTGKFLAHQHASIRPDGVLLGKALGGGLIPVSLFLAQHHLMDVFQPGDHGSTFGGNPLACHVAYEALNTLIDEKLSENAAVLGNHFISELRALQTPLIKKIRGQGLLISLEIDTDIITTADLFVKFVKNGLLTVDTQSRFIRFLPPLIITEKQVEEALLIIQKTCESAI